MTNFSITLKRNVIDGPVVFMSSGSIPGFLTDGMLLTLHQAFLLTVLSSCSMMYVTRKTYTHLFRMLDLAELQTSLLIVINNSL